MKTLALIDYGSGNIRSASRALAEAAKLAELDLKISVTSDPDIIKNSDCIFLPGVGHYADCMKELKARNGIIETLEETVLNGSTPFMGICVGMQLLASIGLEDGKTAGLGFIAGSVDKLKPEDTTLPIPHMGWNEITPYDHPVLAGLGDTPHLYFTHSYAFTPDDSSMIAACADYGGIFSAAVAKDNIFGAQFHPEKAKQPAKNFYPIF